VSRPGRSLPPWKNRYPLYRRLVGSQGRSGQVRTISPPHRVSIIKRGALFLFMSSTQKFKAFSTFIKTLLRATAVTCAVCGATENLACIYFFLCSSSRHKWKIRSCHTTWQSPHMTFFFRISIIFQHFQFLTNGNDITASLRLRSTTNVTTLRLWGHYYGKWGLSEHKHCDNAATNSNSENATSRMVARLRVIVGMGKEVDESCTERVWIAGFHNVTARCRLTRGLKLKNRFSSFTFTCWALTIFIVAPCIL